MTNKSSQNALPQDPFADLENLDWRGDEGAELETLEAQAAGSSGSTAAKKTTHGDKKKSKKKTAASKKGKKRRSRKTTRATAKRKKVSAKTEKKTAVNPEIHVKTEPSVNPGGDQDSVRAADPVVPANGVDDIAEDGSGNAELTDATAMPGTLERRPDDSSMPHHLDLDADSEGDGDDRPSTQMEEVSSQAVGDGSGLAPPLDELIAIVDAEIDETFGPRALPDLGQADLAGAVATEQYVIFSLADSEFAVPIANVTEIGRPLDVTPVPQVPSWLIGIANLRGEIISMVDMRTFLGMQQVGFDLNRRMVIVETLTNDLRAGFIVDRVAGINQLETDRISEPTAKIDDQIAQYLRGVYEQEGQLLALLDLDRLLLSAEMRRFEPA